MSMKLPKIIGLTGGIAAGKSLARGMLERLGVPCIDADRVARSIHQNPAHAATIDIAHKFPMAIDDAGRLCSGSLRTVFAKNKSSNADLKAILKPYVLEQLRCWSQQQESIYVVWESALILEEQIEVDRVLVIDVNPELQFSRIAQRNPDYAIADINSILSLQMTQRQRQKVAQDMISNNASIEELNQKMLGQHFYYLTIWA